MNDHFLQQTTGAFGTGSGENSILLKLYDHGELC